MPPQSKNFVSTTGIDCSNSGSVPYKIWSLWKNSKAHYFRRHLIIESFFPSWHLPVRNVECRCSHWWVVVVVPRRSLRGVWHLPESKLCVVTLPNPLDQVGHALGVGLTLDGGGALDHLPFEHHRLDHGTWKQLSMAVLAGKHPFLLSISPSCQLLHAL